MRLRWFLATLGVRVGGRSMMFLSRYPPEPLWRRLAYVVKPPAPSAPTEDPGAPPWLQPRASELGVTVPLREILASDSELVIALIDCVAFSTGFEFTIAVRSKEEIDSAQMGFGPPRQDDEMQLDDQLRFGIRFPDGGTAMSGGRPSPEFMAQWKMHAEGREPSPEDGPILAPRSGSGDGKRFDFRYWVWPLPPEGTLTFICEWRARGLAVTSHDVDATAIRRAGAASPSLWNGA
jgi:hypothetical protein